MGFTSRFPTPRGVTETSNHWFFDMPSIRKIFRAFLASPSDLQEERRTVRGVVDEFNESFPDLLNYQIELLGWEDTSAGSGRPQKLINQDVDRCDLFIGLIWKRWGTPPDKDGEFSSGFQEEFERSKKRRGKSGSPEIALFFKKIPDDQVEDPGEDLKKVLKFQRTIIEEKNFLFQKFSTARELEKLVRKKLIAYVTDVRKDDPDFEPSEIRAKPEKSEPEKERDEKKSPDSLLFAGESFTFLGHLIDKLGRQDGEKELTASEVARFRLLANSISKPGNQEMGLGAHDINILFSERLNGAKLGNKEIRCLVRLGFQHLSDENIPLWCWYSALQNPWFQAILSSLIGTNDREKVGALWVLSALALDIPTDEQSIITRENILNAWFSEKSSATVRSAALEYLSKAGKTEDYSFAKKEYDRNDNSTNRKALECMVGLSLRTEHENSAHRLILESQFESLDSDILQIALKQFENLNRDELLLGLEHLSAQVRLKALKVLLERDSLDEGMAERLSRDKDAQVRNEAIVALRKLGKTLSESEVEKILVPDGSSDKRGSELFSLYQQESLRNFSLAELTTKEKNRHDDAYFVRAGKYFVKHGQELRRDIDDTFEKYCEESIRRIKAYYGDPPTNGDLVQRINDVEDFRRKTLTRRGLDILCRAGKRNDFQRIRQNLQTDYAGASNADAQYLGKYGEWSDILLLSNVEVGMLSFSQIMSPGGYDNFLEEVAKAVLKISHRHPSFDLFDLEIPGSILKRIVEQCSKSRFSKCSNDSLIRLFYNESPDVRKSASIKAVQTLTRKRIEAILHAYIRGDNFRYYNVIHWLDLRVSMPRAEALKVAQATDR